MKAILEFNLPEDNQEFKMATQGADMFSTLWEIDQWLRSQIKYAPDSMHKEAYKAYEDSRTHLHQFLNKYNIDLG
jgi:hypothetical protein